VTTTFIKSLFCLFLINFIISQPVCFVYVLDLQDLTTFHVITLLNSVTHGESLTRNKTHLNDRKEEIRLLHGRKDDTTVVLLGCKLADDIFTVDIINGDLALTALDDFVDCGLDGGNDKSLVSLRDGDNSRLGLADETKLVRSVVTVVKDDLDTLLSRLLLNGHLVAKGLLQLVEDGLSSLTLEDTVDGLEDKSLVVHVVELDKSVASRAGLGVGTVLLLLFPDALGSSKTVVAITNGKEKRILNSTLTILLALLLRVDKSVECSKDGITSLSLDGKALDLATVEHEISLVDSAELLLLSKLGKRLDDSLLLIVDKKENVRALKRSTTTDLHARRKTLNDGLLGGTDESLCVAREFVLLKINTDDETVVDASANSTLDVDGPLRRDKNTVSEVLLHGALDALDTLSLLISILTQINLRVDDTKGRRSISDKLISIGPVLRLAGELVASNNSPFLQINIVPREQETEILTKSSRNSRHDII